MANYAKHVSTKKTPQTEKIVGSNQVQNAAGGYVYPVDDMVRLERFLILGAEGGSYYVGERKLTQQNAEATIRCIKQNGVATVQKIVEISDSGRAPKNDPAIFALALCTAFGDDNTKREAFSAVNKVCRIGTHIQKFAAACNELRGWGRGLKKAIANWYLSKTPDQLAYQAVKYQQREGWSHRDLLRLSHPATLDSKLQAVLRWITHGTAIGEMEVDRKGIKKSYAATNTVPKLIEGFEQAKIMGTETKTTAKDIVKLIEEYNLPREAIPTRFLKEKEIWEALLYAGNGMPIGALIRNLGNLSKCELLKPLSKTSKDVIKRLTDATVLKKARVHPLAILVANLTYAQGRGVKGSGTWMVDHNVVNALDEAFYLAYPAVIPTGKRWLIALDCSGSMSSSIANSPLSCCQAGSALALVAANTEPQTYVMGFSAAVNNSYNWFSSFRGDNQLIDIGIRKGTRLQDAARKAQINNFGGTDCALPWIWALENKIEVDVCLTITDNETWAGKIHPSQALKNYRQKMGIPAKAIAMAMTATNYSIYDDTDAGCLNVVGFDTAVPEVMAGFVGREGTVFEEQEEVYEE